MKLEQSFDVDAPLDRVWEALVDVERVAPCLPGAAVTGRNDDGTYNGTFTIKIGPTTASYAGKLEMQNVDESAHRATMHAQGSDKRGQGGATATIVSSLSEVEGRTRVEVVTDYHITGRLARFGRGGMIEDISQRLLREFAGRLQSSLVGRGADEAPTAVHEIPTAAAAAGNGGGGAADTPPPPTESAAPATEPAASPSESVAPPAPEPERAPPAEAGRAASPEAEGPAPPEAEGPAPPEPERAAPPEPAPPPPPDPAAAAESLPAQPPAPPAPADAPAPAAAEAPPPLEAAAPPAAETPPAETPAPAETSPPPAPPAQAAPPPPPPPAPPPPPGPPVEPAPPIEGTSLVASVLVDRVKRNPKPVLAVAGGLVLLRLLRRR